jgi:hypothetical protein
MHMFVKWTICTQHEFSPYSFNNSMSNMVIMHIRHLKLIWETLCWFAHLDVKWTISSFDTRKLNLTCLCQYAECVWMSNEQLVHATWIFYPCPFDMFWLLTRCQINMSNEHHFCIFAERVALLVIALFEWQRLPKIEFSNQIILKWSNLGFFLLPNVRKKKSKITRLDNWFSVCSHEYRRLIKKFVFRIWFIARFD